MWENMNSKQKLVVLKTVPFYSFPILLLCLVAEQRLENIVNFKSFSLLGFQVNIKPQWSIPYKTLSKHKTENLNSNLFHFIFQGFPGNKTEGKVGQD